MKNVEITLLLNAAGTQLDSDPKVPKVDPGDTVNWKCAAGAIEVRVDTGLFNGASAFSAAKNQPTAKGKVKDNVQRDAHFNCRVTLDGKAMPMTYGVDTSGTGR